MKSVKLILSRHLHDRDAFSSREQRQSLLIHSDLWNLSTAGNAAHIQTFASTGRKLTSAESCTLSVIIRHTGRLFSTALPGDRTNPVSVRSIIGKCAPHQGLLHPQHKLELAGITFSMF